MQSGENVRKLRHLLTYVMASILTVVGGFYLTRPFFPNVSNEILPIVSDKISSKIMTPYWADKRFDRKDPSRDKIVLSAGDEKIINNIKIVYRGAESRSSFQLDVFVLNFDREMPFAHTLDIAQAKKGFRLGGLDLQLISARKHRIHFWHHKKPPEKR